MTIVALVILGAAEVGLLWLARMATRALAPVKEGNRKRLRAVFHWYAAGLVNSFLLGVIPTFLRAFLDQWLVPVDRALDLATGGFVVLGWLYPLWVQIRGRAYAR